MRMLANREAWEERRAIPQGGWIQVDLGPLLEATGLAGWKEPKALRSTREGAIDYQWNRLTAASLIVLYWPVVQNHANPIIQREGLVPGSFGELLASARGALPGVIRSLSLPRRETLGARYIPPAAMGAWGWGGKVFH